MNEGEFKEFMHLGRTEMGFKIKLKKCSCDCEQ